MKEPKSHSGPIPFKHGTTPEIFYLIDTIDKKLKKLQRQMIKETRLTLPQIYILSLLWARDGRPLNELAAICHCSRSSITGVVDNMERKALVVRTKNPSDRRSLLLKLTDHGKNLRFSIPALDNIFHNCCTTIKREELGKLGVLLKKLEETLLG
ncbi:MAG: MarR family winged helix-turn-helix transcriptional regulator [Candidatus Aminicenantes bacterium]|nr:MarR family winged helix-turn-helix transcriptional regulator [Candidatus Aminicenantes bacterium]